MRKNSRVQTIKASEPEPAAAPVTAPAEIRVAIVEDSPDMRAGLRRLFSESPGFTCLSAHPTAESALRALPGEKPDVVLMDINLPGMDGTACVRRLKAELPGTVFVMLTVYENTERIFQAVQAGASGYLLKRSAPSDLLQAVREARNGGAPMTSLIARKVLDAFRAQLSPSSASASGEALELAAREREVLERLAKGFLLKEIADQLAVSYYTVRTYTERIYEKLHVRSRAEASAEYFKAQR
jgi:DNA-binding NarL/FixJ family response regulator